MAKFSLIPFDSKTAPAVQLFSELNVTDECLYLSFDIKNGVYLVDLGDGHPKKMRTMKLWEKTCFEFFIKNEADNYVEFNFSPTFEWNCFYFEKKGDPLKEWERMIRPETDVLLSENHFFIVVKMLKEFFPPGFFDVKRELTCGITSVIKDKAGTCSYWALHHADTRPNFHHFDSFKYKF